MLKNQKRAYQYGLCAVALWSTVATAFKLSLRYFEPVQLLLVAALTSTLALGALVIKQGKLPLLGRYLRERPLYYLALGTLNPFLYYLLLFKAYDLLPAQQAQTINYTWAISLSLLAVPFLGQKLRRRDGVAILLGYFGALVIATKGDLLGLQFDSPLGVGLALLSTLIWAGYWILNTRNQGDPIVSLLLGFLLSLPLILVATWWLADFRMTAWQGWAGAIYVGLFEMGFGFVLWLMAMRSATDTAPLSNLIFISPFASLILPKPFNPRELLARIRAVLRRHQVELPGAPSATEKVVSFGAYRLDLATRELTRDHEPLSLTSGEFAVLKVLVSHPREPLSRDKLMNLARGREYTATERSIDVQVSRLRRLLEQDPAQPRYLQTVWGLGYVFVPDGESR